MQPLRGRWLGPSSIAQDELRHEVSEQVINSWLEHRPEEANAYFDTASPDPASREIFENLSQELSE